MKASRLLIFFLILAAAGTLGAGLGQLLRPAMVEAPARAGVPLAAPPLRLRNLQWDVGTVEPGARRTRRFEIANPGPDLWTARPVTSTCACVTARLSAEAVAPGESAWLEVTYHAPGSPGRASAHVVAEFAAPGPVIQLSVDGEARRGGPVTTETPPRSRP